jgi:hypothetical protein
MIQELLCQAWEAMKEVDSDVILYPWGGATPQYPPISDVTTVPTDRVGLKAYINKVVWKIEGGPILVELRIGHALPLDKFRQAVEPGLKALNMTLYTQLSQTKAEMVIGWLYCSTQYMDTVKTAASLSKSVGIKLWLWWTIITMTDKNGRYFQQSKDSLVRALHVIVDEPDRELVLVKLAEVLSMKSKVAVYGAQFNFLPLLNHHTNPNMQQVCYKWWIWQATFLENMDTCTMKDIKDLMAEYKGTPLCGYLLSIKQDSHYTKVKDGPGVSRILNRLFYSVDQGRDGVVYQFHQRDRDQAMWLLKSMYAFLWYSNRSPVKSARQYFIDKLFTQQSIALAAAGMWDKGKQNLLTWANRYCEEMENVNDDDSDYEIDSAFAKRFEISFDIEIVHWAQ